MSKQIDLSQYPQSLQLLMVTDGTVTELVKHLVKENILVTKVSETLSDDKALLDRKIYLTGEQSQSHWIYANSLIHLSKLPENFVSDLLDRSLPIGTLWNKYKVETYKKMIRYFTETTPAADSHLPDQAFAIGVQLLCRSYEVYNNQRLIMTITEKFPIQKFEAL